MEADEDGDGKLSFNEFARTVANTVCDFVLLFLFLGVFGQKHSLVLAKTCSRVSRAVCVFPYSIFITDGHVNLHRFSAYCKANEARRLILDVAYVRWSLTHVNQRTHSADNRLHTYQ
jgi:hypothetical protein